MEDYCCEPVETPEQVKSDYHMVQLRYKCTGKLVDRPFYARQQALERFWVWEKEGCPPLISWHEVNHWCHVVPLKDAV